MGEVVFVTSDSLVERFSEGKPAEVEGCAPTILIKIGREIIIAMRAWSVGASV